MRGSLRGDAAAQAAEGAEAGILKAADGGNTGAESLLDIFKAAGEDDADINDILNAAVKAIEDTGTEVTDQDRELLKELGSKLVSNVKGASGITDPETLFNSVINAFSEEGDGAIEIPDDRVIGVKPTFSTTFKQTLLDDAEVALGDDVDGANDITDALQSLNDDPSLATELEIEDTFGADGDGVSGDAADVDTARKEISEFDDIVDRSVDPTDVQEEAEKLATESPAEIANEITADELDLRDSTVADALANQSDEIVEETIDNELLESPATVDADVQQALEDELADGDGASELSSELDNEQARGVRFVDNPELTQAERVASGDPGDSEIPNPENSQTRGETVTRPSADSKEALEDFFIGPDPDFIENPEDGVAISTTGEIGAPNVLDQALDSISENKLLVGGALGLLGTAAVLTGELKFSGNSSSTNPNDDNSDNGDSTLDPTIAHIGETATTHAADIQTELNQLEQLSPDDISAEVNQADATIADMSAEQFDELPVSQQVALEAIETAGLLQAQQQNEPDDTSQAHTGIHLPHVVFAGGFQDEQDIRDDIKDSLLNDSTFTQIVDEDTLVFSSLPSSLQAEIQAATIAKASTIGSIDDLHSLSTQTEAGFVAALLSVGDESVADNPDVNFTAQDFDNFVVPLFQSVSQISQSPTQSGADSFNTLLQLPSEQLAALAQDANDGLTSLQSFNTLSTTDRAQNLMVVLANTAINGSDPIDSDETQSIQGVDDLVQAVAINNVGHNAGETAIEVNTILQASQDAKQEVANFASNFVTNTPDSDVQAAVQSTKEIEETSTVVDEATLGVPLTTLNLSPIDDGTISTHMVTPQSAASVQQLDALISGLTATGLLTIGQQTSEQVAENIVSGIKGFDQLSTDAQQQLQDNIEVTIDNAPAFIQHVEDDTTAIDAGFTTADKLAEVNLDENSAFTAQSLADLNDELQSNPDGVASDLAASSVALMDSLLTQLNIDTNTDTGTSTNPDSDPDTTDISSTPIASTPESAFSPPESVNTILDGLEKQAVSNSVFVDGQSQMENIDEMILTVNPTFAALASQAIEAQLEDFDSEVPQTTLEALLAGRNVFGLSEVSADSDTLAQTFNELLELDNTNMSQDQLASTLDDFVAGLSGTSLDGLNASDIQAQQESAML